MATGPSLDKTANHAHVSVFFAGSSFLPAETGHILQMRYTSQHNGVSGHGTNNIIATPNRSHEIISAVWNLFLSRPILEI